MTIPGFCCVRFLPTWSHISSTEPKANTSSRQEVEVGMAGCGAPISFSESNELLEKLNICHVILAYFHLWLSNFDDFSPKLIRKGTRWSSQP